MKMYCGSWWCDYPIKQVRRIDDVVVCRSCYQYVWEQAQKTGESMAAVFRKVEPPKRTPVRKRIKCSRSGCEVVLTPEMDSSEYRWLNRQKPLCRNCYETVWEYKKKFNLNSMEEAFDQLYPYGWQPPPPEPAKCVMPWCKNDVPKKEPYLLEGERYVCGTCKSYLHTLRRRHKSEHDWKWYARNATRGMVPAPGSPELCAAKWCNAKVTEFGRRGPNGEALCNNDAMYFYMYARRNSITFAEAFRSAPPPRLLHTRGRAS